MPRIPLYLQTILALFAGGIVGYLWGPGAKTLQPVTASILWIIKSAAIPLLFLTVAETFMKAGIRWRSLIRVVAVAVVNALCAVIIALSIVNLFKPGIGLQIAAGSASRNFQSLTPVDALEMLITSPMIIAIFLAIVTGLVLKRHFKKYQKFLEGGLTLWLKVLGLILHLVPFAVFSSVAGVVGSVGFSAFSGLSYYFFLCLAGMVLQIALVYQGWILLYGRIGFRQYWVEAKEPLLHAFGVNSSLATLPLTLSCLKRLRVSDASARLSACVATNFNNDGILLYQVFTLLVLTQAYGFNLSLSEQLLMALFSMVACLGIGGVPEAGLIALSIVLATFDLPLEGISFFLAVDWLLARFRSVINVVGDMACAVAIDRRCDKVEYQI